MYFLVTLFIINIGLTLQEMESSEAVIKSDVSEGPPQYKCRENKKKIEICDENKDNSRGSGESKENSGESKERSGENKENSGESKEGSGESKENSGESNSHKGSKCKSMHDDSHGGKGSSNHSGEEHNESAHDHSGSSHDTEDMNEFEVCYNVCDDIKYGDILESSNEELSEFKEKIAVFKDKVKAFGEKIKEKFSKEGLLLAGASLTASILVVQVAVLPLVFRYSKAVQRKIVFSNCINYPRNLNYENPSSVNIIGGRNFHIQFQSKVDDCLVQIGIWHIIPRSMFRRVFIIRDSQALESELLQELKTTKNTIVLYCHGNSNHRASPHRLQMYKVFQELNFHVITFDYRGYGDSTSIRPTERGVVEDCLHVYSWLMKALDPQNRPTVLLWGHSLGTAVASNVVAHMSSLCAEHGLPTLPMPDILVLEAAFNNLTDEIESHPFSKLVSWLPYYRESFIKPFAVSSEYAFTTDQYLEKVPHLPTLMLHSKGDRIVPYQLAVKLYEHILKSRSTSSAPLVFHSFSKRLRLGHNNICEAQDLQAIVRNFIDFVRETTKEIHPQIN